MYSKPKKENSVSVIGAAGHIGLPLSFLLAKHKFNVIGIDKDSKKIEMINKRKMPFMENNLKELFQNKKLKIKLTENINEIKKTKYIIVTLGTPIDEYLNPSYTSFFKVIDKIINLLDDSQILILRSTLAPGTTRKILEKIKNKRLKTGIAFCPERISQGNAVSEIYKLPQIISFSDLKTKKACKKIFKNFTNEIIECSFEEAEISKLFCNSWRYIKFAVANEFYKICKLHDLNFEKINTDIFPIVKIKNRLNEYPSTSVIINASNEILVDQFLSKNLPFLAINKIILAILKHRNYKNYAIRKPNNLKQINVVDKWARNITLKKIKSHAF